VPVCAPPNSIFASSGTFRLPPDVMRSLSCGSSSLVPSGVVANTNDAGPSLVAKV